MTKAKAINRLELTYKKFPHLRPKNWKPDEANEVMPDIDIHGDTCPHCGQKTLIHESGCVKCTSCAWSACG